MRETRIQAMLIPLIRSTGAQKTSTVTIAKGTAAIFIKGILLPAGLLLRSERVAIKGSVIASKILHMNVISPRTVRRPKTTSPVGI